MMGRILTALVAIAAIIVLGLYFYFSGGPPAKAPEKPKESAAKSQTTPAPQEKAGEKPGPGPSGAPGATPAPGAKAGAPSAPAPLEKSKLLTPQPIPPQEQPATKPETEPGAPKATELPPLEPKEQYGLLAGRYRKYRSAAKKMAKLKKRDQPAFIRKDKGRYQVWVGPFPTKEGAEAAARLLKKKGKFRTKLQKIIIPVPK